jgi:predicted nucleic acid-binding protein
MKVFLDTSVFIYYVEDHPIYAQAVEGYLDGCIQRSDEWVTSVVTPTEYGVKPFIENRPELIQDFKDLVHQLGIDMVSIDEQTAERAY